MSQEIIRNPADLDIIDNPNQTINTMANKTDQALDTLRQQAKTAAYLLGGQAVAAQVNGIAVPKLLKNQNATVQQIARAGIPLTLGVILAMSTKNEILRGVSLGVGMQGVLETIKFVMPNFNPSTGLAEGSHFVFQDQDGNERPAMITPDGRIVTEGGAQPQLPAANADTSETTTGELAGWQDPDSEYASSGEEVEYI